MFKFNQQSISAIQKQILFLLAYVVPSSILTGSTVAGFLYVLEKATSFRNSHTYLLYFLPLGGVLIYFIYKYFGKNSAAGNNLIIEEIRKKGLGVPFVMAPLVLIGTVITHLFGGSAGREGTAVQMGGSIADTWGRLLSKIDNNQRAILLTSGIAAGFSAVFGTPVTGLIFALEVIYIGNLKYDAVLSSLIAAVLANYICRSLGIHHASYTINDYKDFTELHFLNYVKIALAGIAFGFGAYLFSQSLISFKKILKKYIHKDWLMPVVGAVIVILGSWIIGPDYLGLGVTANTGAKYSLSSAFLPGGSSQLSWLWKLLFTAITLSSGFKGGEVTPLFFIGAALGNALSIWLNIPTDLLAGIGFVALFAGATNTPLACTVMGIELFGGEYTLYFAIACFISYLCSGNSSIYTSQQIKGHKWLVGGHENITTIADYIKNK